MSKFLTSPTIIEKQSGETINIGMEFARWLASGIIISNPSVSVVPDDGLLVITDVGVAVSGTEASMTVAGGTPGQRYRINVTIETSDDQVFIGDGILLIRDR